MGRIEWVPKTEEVAEKEKVPEGTIFEWMVDSERGTVVIYYFSENEWWSVGNTQEKPDKEAQEKLTKAYLEEINQKFITTMGIINKAFFTEKEKLKFYEDPRAFFEKDLEISNEWIKSSQKTLDKETIKKLKKHIRETTGIIEYLEQNPKKFKPPEKTTAEIKEERQTETPNYNLESETEIKERCKGFVEFIMKENK